MTNISLLKLKSLLILALSMSACTSWNQPDSPLEAYRQALADQEFLRAEKIIESVPATHPDYRRLQNNLKELNRKKHTYQNSRLKAANLLQKQHRWLEAEAVLERAIKRAGKTTPLVSAQTRLAKDKQRYLTLLTDDAMLARASVILEEQQAWQKAVEAEPSWSNKRRLSTIQKERKEITEYLIDCGDREAQSGDRNHARRCFTAALGLKESPKLQEKLRMLGKQRGKMTQMKGKKVRQPALSIAELKQEYETALKDNNWLLAQQKITSMNRLQPDALSVQVLTEDFYRQREGYLGRQMTLAQQLYSSGKVESALKIWQDIQPLDPANEEISDRISRAEHFLKKLKRLKSTQ